MPKERLPLVNGCLMAAGGLGVAAASAPVQMALDIMTWRELFQLVAVITLVVAVIIFVAVPERRAEGEPRGLADQFRGLGQILGSRIFWGTAPLVMTVQSGWMTIQALWFGAWFARCRWSGRPGCGQRAFHGRHRHGGRLRVDGGACRPAGPARCADRRHRRNGPPVIFIVIQALIALDAPVDAMDFVFPVWLFRRFGDDFLCRHDPGVSRSRWRAGSTRRWPSSRSPVFSCSSPLLALCSTSSRSTVAVMRPWVTWSRSVSGFWFQVAAFFWLVISNRRQKRDGG